MSLLIYFIVLFFIGLYLSLSLCLTLNSFNSALTIFSKHIYLSFYSINNLCITNSFFKTKPQHKVSWRHLHSNHWHQLDLILVRCAAIKNVLHTCSYHSADCNTDHSLDQAATKKVPSCKETREPAY